MEETKKDEIVEEEEEELVVEEQEPTPKISVPQEPKPNVIKEIEEPPSTTPYHDALRKPPKPKPVNKKNVKIKPPKPHPRIKLRSPEIPSAGRIKKRWPISKGEYKGSYQSYKGGKENRRGSKRRKGASRSRSRVCWNPVWDPGKRERSAPRGSRSRAYQHTIRIRQVCPKIIWQVNEIGAE